MPLTKCTQKARFSSHNFDGIDLMGIRYSMDRGSDLPQNSPRPPPHGSQRIVEWSPSKTPAPPGYVGCKFENRYVEDTLPFLTKKCGNLHLTSHGTKKGTHWQKKQS